GAVVRHLVGYDRFASRAAYRQLGRVYRLARLHVNFFQPVEKLVAKTREGAPAHRVYDRAQTPYQRLCATGVLSAERRRELETLYQNLNPTPTASGPRARVGTALDPRRARSPARPGGHRHSHPPPEVLTWSLLDDGFGNPEF